MTATSDLTDPRDRTGDLPEDTSAPSSDPSGANGGPDPRQAVPAAPVAVGTPSAVPVALLLCLGLVALGVLLLRELLVGREVAGTVLLPGEPWFGPLLTSATSVVPGDVAALAGAGGLVLGVLLVAAAVSSRPRRSIRLGAKDEHAVPVDLDGRGVSSLAADAALQHPEVGTSRAGASGRRVVVDVSVDPRDDHDESELATELTRRVGERLGDLQPRPKVRVRVHGAVRP